MQQPSCKTFFLPTCCIAWTTNPGGAHQGGIVGDSGAGAALEGAGAPLPLAGMPTQVNPVTGTATAFLHSVTIYVLPVDSPYQHLCGQCRQEREQHHAA